MKTLWVVGAGKESVPGIKRAKEMGLRVVASDGNAGAPGFAFADLGIIENTYDGARTAWASKAVPAVDGVIAMCTDVPVTVAAVANALGLPGLPLDVAGLGADKLAMKERLREKGIPTAWGCVAESAGQIRRLLIQREKPLVVKPVDSRGARGVVRLVPWNAHADKDVSLTVTPRWAFDQAKAQSPTGRVMVEDWLSGQQYSTEALFVDDGVLPLALRRNYDRLEEFLPYMIEDGADGPVDLSCDDKAMLDGVFVSAALAVVGRDFRGTVKGDMVMTPDGPKVIELALRLSGGYMSTELLPRMTGVDFIGHAIRLALGEPLRLADLHKHEPRGVAIRFKIPVGCRSHPERHGHVIADAETRAEAVQIAEAKVAAL